MVWTHIYASTYQCLRARSLSLALHLPYRSKHRLIRKVVCDHQHSVTDIRPDLEPWPLPPYPWIPHLQHPPFSEMQRDCPSTTPRPCQLVVARSLLRIRPRCSLVVGMISTSSCWWFGMKVDAYRRTWSILILCPELRFHAWSEAKERCHSKLELFCSRYHHSRLAFLTGRFEHRRRCDCYVSVIRHCQSDWERMKHPSNVLSCRQQICRGQLHFVFGHSQTASAWKISRNGSW